MQIRSKITHRRTNPPIKRAAQGQVPTETHARGADAAGAGGKGEEVGDGQGGVFVVGGEGLGRSMVSGEVSPGVLSWLEWIEKRG